MVFSAHRRSLFLAAVAITLAIGAVAVAPAARAYWGDGDALAEMYGLQRQGCARQPDSLGCGSFGNPAAIAARPATPSPSRAAVRAGLRHVRHPIPR
jgi:hypothetical protein